MAAMITRQEYDAAFDCECLNIYPEIDAFEQEMGFALDNDRLLSAARVLACPVKVNPPSWQHGRILYAALRHYIATTKLSDLTVLDIGTAKGFSALCMQWALNDAGVLGHVISLDVINPNAQVRRNTVAEIDGFRDLHETLAPWPAAKQISFLHSTGAGWLRKDKRRVHFAFVDGKHEYNTVLEEGTRLRKNQENGDTIVFDDVQKPKVAKAIAAIGGRMIKAGPNRIYCLSRRT